MSGRNLTKVFLLLLKSIGIDGRFYYLVRSVPGESLLVELDDCLGALDVGQLRRDQVRLVTSLPLHQEHQLTCQRAK